MDNNNEPVINGISCDVANCVHNNGCNCCTAGQIHVANKSENPEKTCCETFAEI